MAHAQQVHEVTASLKAIHGEQIEARIMALVWNNTCMNEREATNVLAVINNQMGSEMFEDGHLAATLCVLAIDDAHEYVFARWSCAGSCVHIDHPHSTRCDEICDANCNILAENVRRFTMA